ncbi:MAG: hypothetical protein Q9191_004550 [Dirinaria sp. TL-2023a]
MSSGSNAVEVNIAAAALGLSMVALAVASAQLLGQFFATADGYRRCQPSVMGHWARQTRLRWRWSQFRFEALFTTPDICLYPRGSNHHVPDASRGASKNSLKWLISSDTNSNMASEATDLASQKSLVKRSSGIDGLAELESQYILPPSAQTGHEMAGWLVLLQDLGRNEWELRRQGVYVGPQKTNLLSVACRLQERSWDFMPPELLRPMARTTVADIAMMARRLGMEWSSFRPEEGIMSAQGHGHIIYATFVRSLGVVLHYMRTGVGTYDSDSSSLPIKELSKDAMFVPTREASMLGFGILPGCQALGVPNYYMSSIEEVYDTANKLDRSGNTSQQIRNVRGIERTCTFGFSDLIPMAAPILRLRGSKIIRVPIPTEYCVGLTCHREGFVIFHHRLQDHIRDNKPSTSSDKRLWVVEQYESLKTAYPEWENEIEANMQANDRSLEFLEKVHDLWDQTTEYFAALQSDPKINFCYTDLLAVHVKHVVHYWNDA